MDLASKPRLAARFVTRCSAHTRLGVPCRRNAFKGATVCHTHGGAAPQVREAARLRLACLVSLALRRLALLIAKGEGAQALGGLRGVLTQRAVCLRRRAAVDWRGQ